MRKLLSSISNLLFPPSCLHCRNRETDALLCSKCAADLLLIDPVTRCSGCFSDAIDRRGKLCDACRDPKKFRAADYVAACFDYMGPVESLVREFKFANAPYLAKSLGAFLYLQFLELGWEEPDFITFIPQNFMRFMHRGYNQSELLALDLGRHLQRPVVKLMKKNHTTLSQTQIARKMRESLPSTLFSAIEKECIEDKVILLIDDVYTTGTTIQRAASCLQEYLPKRLYALTLCRS